MDNLLIDILKAREDRGKMRIAIAKKAYASISLSFNIAGYPKNDKLTNQAFDLVIEDLLIFLKANLVSLLQKEEINIIDKAGNFFICALKGNDAPNIIKDITEQFENQHFLSRIIDVDVFDKNALPISSNKLKKCLICNNTAINCMRIKQHSNEEIRAYIYRKLNLFIEARRKEVISKKLIEIINRSLLYEVSLSPKPGLVDFNSVGSHTDMNYFSFINSTSALSPYWNDVISAGWDFDSNLDKALSQIRNIGLRAEQAMFISTNGVNTQKGLVFLMSISAFAISYLLKNKIDLSNKNTQNCIKKICNNIVYNELEVNDAIIDTHGENTYDKYGKKGAGARFEAQEGFPVVFEYSLPFLMSNAGSLNINNIEQTKNTLHKTLYLIIANLSDSNILHRKGEVVANNFKTIASKVFNGEISNEAAIQYCDKESISPGGSADMLAISLFYYFINQEIYKS